MTLINEHNSDENICFENKVFDSTNLEVAKKRTPPPIPKRRSSAVELVTAAKGQNLHPSVCSSAEVCSISSGDAQKTSATHGMGNWESGNRESPLPILPAPPSVKRSNSRKDRKRPAYMDSISRHRNGETSGQLFRKFLNNLMKFVKSFNDFQAQFCLDF